MNDEMISHLLRLASAPQAPEGLREQLISQIRLPALATGDVSWDAPSPWFRRWLPAMAFATLLLTCVVVVGMQVRLLQNLQSENQTLRADTADLDKLRASNKEVQSLRNQNAELDHLVRDNAELQKLNSEMAQLQTKIVQISQLRAENIRLKSEHASGSTVSNDFFADSKAKAERIACANNLKQIGLAARIWQGDNGNNYPVDFISMTNELSTWRVLQCPGDTAHTVTSWADVVAGNVSYVLDAPGGDDSHPTVVYAECPIHHNFLLSDGSVQQLSEKGMQDHLKIVNGRKVME